MNGYRSAPQIAQKIARDLSLLLCLFVAGSRLPSRMSLFFANKVVRLLLALSVSIWMAGGCLFGCSNSALASGQVDDSTPTIEAGESCHAVQSHHCCTTKKVKKQVARATMSQPLGLPSFMPAPHGSMTDCPLVVNATAATSKNSTNVPDPGRVSVAVLPRFDKQTIPVDNSFVVTIPPDLGPAHLRCCVFLI